MDAEEVRPLRRHDVVELRGIVAEVDLDGASGQVRITLGRGVPTVWVPVGWVQRVPFPGFDGEDEA